MSVPYWQGNSPNHCHHHFNSIDSKRPDHFQLVQCVCCPLFSPSPLQNHHQQHHPINPSERTRHYQTDGRHFVCHSVLFVWSNTISLDKWRKIAKITQRDLEFCFFFKSNKKNCRQNMRVHHLSRTVLIITSFFRKKIKLIFASSGWVDKEGVCSLWSKLDQCTPIFFN